MPEGCLRSPGYLVYLASLLFSRATDRDLKPLGVTAAQLAPLLILDGRGPLVQRDLLKAWSVAQPAMVALLGRLETNDLITRRADELDGRASLVALTEKGRQVVAAATPILVRARTRGLDGFTAAEAEDLIGLLERLVGNLKRLE